MPERRPVGFGRRDGADAAASGDSSRRDDEAPWPDDAVRLDDDLAASLLPERPARGHKGSFGKLLVVAGSLDYAGAALLVCRAAGRAGVGLVTLAVPESLQPLFAAKVVEATTMALPEDDVEEIDPEPALARILDHEHDALVVGPGLRPGLATAELVRELIAGAAEGDSAPLVLDAEALRSLATIESWWDGERRRAVLTPHAGEFGRLRAGAGHDASADGDLMTDDAARVAAARDAATTWHQVVVLKGARTVIAAPDGDVAIAPFENPALATGGTGDVLAGAIGALLAQGLEPFAAARLGVYLHGAAGDAARERFGDAGVLAADLPDGLAYARRRLATLAERRRGGKRLGFGGRGAAHHERAGVGHGRGLGGAPGVPCRRQTGGVEDTRPVERVVARIELWNGDICDLEVDAIVNPANLSLWMSTGVGGAIKRAGGDAIEFAAVRQAPVPLGGAIVTTGGRLAAKAVIHAVSLDRERRTSAAVIEAAVRSAMARGREIGATSIAFPALGTGVGGFPLDESARITIATVRDELRRSPDIAHVIFALRGAAPYEAFGAALAAIPAANSSASAGFAP